jgi:hypothetical protein
MNRFFKALCGVGQKESAPDPPIPIPSFYSNIDVVNVMRITLLAILLLPLLMQCGEPAKTEPLGAVVAAAGHSGEWSNRRCRCVRSDRRGCVQWQCRRA